MIRTRFAPSPTGLMHIGSVRTALYAYLVARKFNGVFFLRIEDTDRKRFIPSSIEDIIRNIKWLGLNFDNAPIFQSERKGIYQKFAKELVEKEFAYEKEGAIWFKIPPKGKTTFNDLIGNRKIEFENSSQKDFVILKSDGFPTYHLAHVVDDHLMEISLVIRGEEWLSSTPKHIFLSQALNWPIPNYAHLPLILGPDRSKLSKRHGAKSVSEFRKTGFLPDAILNYMVLLGWTPPSVKELLTVEEMIEKFDLKDVHTTSAVFDIKKLTWMNGVYIRQKNINELLNMVKDYLAKYSDIKITEKDETKLGKILIIAKERMNTLREFLDQAEHFFKEPKIEIKNKNELLIVKDLIKYLEGITVWKSEEIFSLLKKVMLDYKIRMPLLYNIFTGKESGLPLPQSLEILGKEKTINRLKSLK